MPIIYTGGNPHNQSGDKFAAGLATGMRLKHERRRLEVAEQRERAYQEALEQAQEQIRISGDLARIKGEEMAAQHELGRAQEMAPAVEGMGALMGGPAAALSKLYADGVGSVPEQEVTLSYLMARRPEALDLYARLDPEHRTRFEQDIVQMAEQDAEQERVGEFVGRSQAAEGVYVPEGWTQEAVQAIQNQGTTVVEAERELERLRHQHAKVTFQVGQNQDMLEEAGSLVQALSPRLDPETRQEVAVTLAELQADAQALANEAQAKGTAKPLDRGLWRKLHGLLEPGRLPQQAGRLVEGMMAPFTNSPLGGGGAPPAPQPAQGQGPPESPPAGRKGSGGADSRPLAERPAAAQRALLEQARADLPDLVRQAKSSRGLRRWGEARGLTPDEVAALGRAIRVTQDQGFQDEIEDLETIGTPMLGMTPEQIREEVKRRTDEQEMGALRGD